MEEETRDGLRIRFLTEDECKGSLPKTFGHEAKIHRLALRKAGFTTHGLAEQCPRCQAMLHGKSRQAHTEEFHDHMCDALKKGSVA